MTRIESRRGSEPSGLMREMARGASTTLLMRVAGGGFEFLLNLAIARMFGAEGAGLFYIALTVTMIGSVVARLGLDNSLLRLGAAHAATGEWGLVASAARRGLVAALVTALVISAALSLALGMAARVRPDFEDTLNMAQLAVIAIAPFSIACLMGELLKSQQRIFASQLIAAVVIPGIALLLVATVGHQYGIKSAILSYDVAAFIAALLGWYWWTNAMPQVSQGSEMPWREVFRGTWSLLWIKFARLAAGWVATAALVVWSTKSDVGIYNVALRISLALGLLLMSVNSVVAPRFSAQIHLGDRKLLNQSARQATALVVAVAGPIVAVLLLAPAWVMSWFGAEFATAGASVLFVLTLGQCINLLTGPVNYLLMMSGNEEALRHCMTASVFVGVLATFLLTPSLGALGAAIGTASAMVLQSLAAAYIVWSKLGIVTIPLLAQPAPRGLG